MTYFAPGTRLLDRFEIGPELGRGGHSVVYRARDLTLNSAVAVKLLVPPPATQELARERMRREVLAVRTLSHPHIVPVYDYLTEGPWQFIIMRLVEGRDLEQRIAASGPLAPATASELGRSIAAALDCAHREGILHRDVKPRNILLDAGGAALLTDFGSARILASATMTETGGLVGTLAYAAPELMTGTRADARSDVYALGLTLYFALTGELPPQASPHLPPGPSEDGFHPRTANLSVPAGLDETIARATRADPADRFPTAASLREALGDPTLAAAPLTTWEDHCLVCGAIDVEGLTICRRCGRAADPTDALIFLDPGHTQDRDDRLAQLLVWFGGSSAAGHHDVVLGRKPLARVPEAMVEAAVDRLAARGLAARAIPVRSAWQVIPAGLWLLAALTVAVGLYAGGVVHPALYWTSPLFAALLLSGGMQAGRLPLLDRAPRGARLGPELEREVIATAAELPPGVARDLFGGVVRLARHLAGGEAADGRVGLLAELLPVAGRGARELARLDEAVALVAGGAGVPGELRGELERRRDRLVQQFLEAQGGLRRLAALPGTDESPAMQLRQLAGAMDRLALAERELGEMAGR